MRPCPQCGTLCEEEHQYCPGCGFPVGAIPAQSEDKFVGQTLPGGYLILDLISVGGMGRVYRAEQRVLGRTVAVKIIHPHLLSDENSSVRFLTEARAASQLNHPNSVSVIDFGKTKDGQPYLVMEFLRGKDLALVAYEEGPLPFARVVEILRQVLMALADAHEIGIIHRDMKPENVIVERMRRGGDLVKVVDFGLAKLKYEDKGTGVTSPGIVCGTPDYMAPEQGRGDPLDGRTDVYAVGVILFQLLTGRLPFESDNPTQVVMMHLSVPVPDPRHIAPERDIPEPLVRVLNKALQKDATHRYQDALEYADALKDALDSIKVADSAPASASSASPVSMPMQSTQCPACEVIVPMSKFCGECGARLPLRTVMPEATEPPSLPLPFVGRDEDIAWLEDRRAEVEKGVGAARIVGEPGSGKTRLLQEFLARAKADGNLVISTGPDPFYAEVAYHAVRRAVSGLAGLDGNGAATSQRWKDAKSGARRALVEAFRSAPVKDDTRTPEERRRGMADALRWAFVRATERSGNNLVVLAIDELHRVDGASREAFADALGEPPANARVLVVGAHAPGFEAGWSSKYAARVLGGLPPPTVSRLVAATRPGEKLHVPTDGAARGVLPLYVDQLVRFFMEGGSDAPPRLADLIAERMGSLGPDARRALQALAVLGDEVDVELVSTILPDAVDVDATFSRLGDAGMVVRSGNVVSSAHPLIRDIALSAVPAGVRKDLHSKAVRAFEKVNAPIEARAIHSFYSQDAFEALLLLEQIADRGLARGDNATAILALRRGLELARQEISRGELDDPLRAVLIFSRKLGDALTRAGNFSDAEGVLREALDMAGPSGTDRARVLEALAHVAHGRHRADEAFAFIDEAIQVARRSGAHDLIASLRTTRKAWAVTG